MTSGMFEGKTVIVAIRWPSGKRESIAGVKANQAITLEEGKGIIAQEPIEFSGPVSKKTQ